MGYLMIWKTHKINIIAMAAFVAWLWFFPLFGIAQITLEDVGVKTISFNLIFLASTALGYVTFLYLKERRSLSFLITVAAPATAMATWLVALLSWQLTTDIIIPWGHYYFTIFTILSVIMGFGGAIYFAFWGTTIYHIPFDEKGRYMAAMVVVATTLYTALVAVFHAVPFLAIVISGLILLFPSLTIKTTASFIEESQTVGVSPTFTPIKTDISRNNINYWKAFWFPFSLTIFCFYILAWETHNIVFSVFKEENTLLPILGQAIYALTFVVAGYYLDKAKEIEKMAIFGLIVLGCSFLLIPVALPAVTLWPIYYLLEVSYGFIDLFMWVSLAYFCQLLSGDPKTFYARGLLLNILFIMSGTILMPLISISFEGEGYLILSITAGIILFIGILPAMSLRKFRFAGHAKIGLSDIIDQEIGKLKADLQIDSFTQKEKEVILLILAGQNNSMIAEQLGISKNTLKTHIRNIYSKAEVKNRSELLFKFAELKKNTKI